MPSRFSFIESPYSKELGVDTDQHGTRHYVTPKGRKYPSITTVLKNYKKDILDNWKKRVGEKEANKIAGAARVRGNDLHGILEKYIQGEEVKDLQEKYNYKIQNMFGSIKPVLDNNLTEIHLQESAIFSDVLKVAGRLDLLGTFDDKLSIIDFKGSSKPKKKEWITNYFMQATAYAFMYFEQTRIPVTQIVIIIANENGTVDTFRENPADHLENLQKEIARYYSTLL